MGWARVLPACSVGVCESRSHQVPATCSNLCARNHSLGGSFLDEEGGLHSVLAERVGKFAQGKRNVHVRPSKSIMRDDQTVIQGDSIFVCD